MKKVLQYLLLVMVAAQGYCQELNLPVFTQYLADNDFVVSPTFAGIGDNFRIRANGLTQWVGIKNAPQNLALYTDIRIANRSGAGLSAYVDRNGNTRQNGFKLSFAHHLILDLTTQQYLSFGLSYNVNNFRIAIEDFNTTYENPTIDPRVTDDRSTTNHNFDVGALYRIGEFWLSANANNLLPKDEDIFTGFEPNALLNLQFYSGYIFKLSNYSEVEPSTFVQLFASDGRSSTDLNFKYRKYNGNDDFWWVGGSFRFLNDQGMIPLNLGPMVGLKKSFFYVSYAYQLTLNDLTTYNTGTHALTVGFDLFQSLSVCPCTKGKYRKGNKLYQ
ncbi:type IX secretion system membrane protein PorP/SprF [Aureisphaera galaxeae]|uniref:PorP/SprF family type IX secretion system membrane protein n=1 Tax=Aureisphaera galaxeae TaxID=1538023 RepID=UPI002350C7A0|nr:type IX secretion system membrane protein PorP/SprF [Aureisphaera galaxeae]MDC8002590.1 type IX secretion system membrane protein PorP/SprF [Aureisphaera galaxeae]